MEMETLGLHGAMRLAAGFLPSVFCVSDVLLGFWFCVSFCVAASFSFHTLLPPLVLFHSFKTYLMFW
jgi:hypothetical protein